MTVDPIDAAFTLFPSITTERLRLRPIQTDDAEALFAIKSDLEVTRRYGQEPHGSLDETRAWIGRVQASAARRDALFWCLTLRGHETAIGACTLWNLDPSFHCAELGYELHRAHWGEGLMTEAASTVVAYGFTELGLHRIEACPLAGNPASGRLLLKLGFTREGNLRQRAFFRGHFEDQLYFGLLVDEWTKAAAAAPPTPAAGPGRGARRSGRPAARPPSR
jgi:ribosomal-protein-alanine N-acetyltransferase